MQEGRSESRLVLVAVSAFIFAVSTGSAQDISVPSDVPSVAPIRTVVSEHEDPRLGFVPPAVDLPPIDAPLPEVLPLAARFDWRESGAVTPVKNQGPCGSCYAFASTANIESKLLVDGAASYDLSENYAKECEWFGSSCSGGNYWRVANLLTAQGAVLESCDPYVASDVTCADSCPHVAALLDWCEFSHDAPASTAAIKAYLETYGPIYTAMNAGHGDAWATEFNHYDGSYTLYYAGTEPTNHAVLIVGWDDTLSHAGGQGAWIVKNSWGPSWGGPCGYGTEGGYFTIAYESARIGSWSSFARDWKAFDPQDKVLFYDEGGYTQSVGYGVVTAWGFCKYAAGEDFTVDRVEFWTADATTDIDVYIYDSFNGTSLSGLLASSLNNAFDLPGYHSVEIAAHPHIASGNDIFVTLKITDATYKYPMVFDVVGPRSPATSYISYDGSGWGEWTGGDLGIRLRVGREISCGVVTAEPVISEIADVPADGGGEVRLTWRRSSYDTEGSSPAVRRYKIWRHVRSVGGGGTLIGEPLGGLHSSNGPHEFSEDGPVWELVGTMPATGACNYTFDAPTVCDGGECKTQFRVVAHTGNGWQHFESPTAIGYSVDNLSGGGEGNPSPTGPYLPTSTGLLATSPNPGWGGFTIALELAAPDWAEICVYDIMGRRVASLLDGYTPAGTHSVRWDAKVTGGQDAAPGVYFVRLVTLSEAHTVKLILMR